MGAQTGTIEAAMTAFPYSIDADAHAASAATMLHQLGIHHLPVRDGGRVVGLISADDLKRAANAGRDLSIAGNVRVADVCTHDVHIVEPEAALPEVLLHMADHRLDVVLIVRRGHLIGIYTFGDACRGYAETLQNQAGALKRR